MSKCGESSRANVEFNSTFCLEVKSNFADNWQKLCSIFKIDIIYGEISKCMRVHVGYLMVCLINFQ